MSDDTAGLPDLGALLQELVNRISHRGQGEVLAMMQRASVTLPQLLVLTLLWQRGECTLSELARERNMSQSSISQMIERLFQLGYLQRAEDPEDRRRKRLALTPTAQRLVVQLAEARSAEYREGVAGLSPELKTELAKVLRQVLAQLSEQSGSPTEPDALERTRHASVPQVE